MEPYKTIKPPYIRDVMASYGALVDLMEPYKMKLQEAIAPQARSPGECGGAQSLLKGFIYKACEGCIRVLKGLITALTA